MQVIWILTIWLKEKYENRVQMNDLSLCYCDNIKDWNCNFDMYIYVNSVNAEVWAQVIFLKLMTAQFTNGILKVWYFICIYNVLLIYLFI